MNFHLYDELSIGRASRAFKVIARSYCIKIIDSKDSSIQLTISKSIIKDFFKDLLYEIKCIKYQITLKVLLSKYKEYRDREFAPVYFNSTTKTVICPEDSLDRSFQDVFNRIDNWISEGSG